MSLYSYGIVIAFLVFLTNIPNVFAGGSDRVGNFYFSIDIPDSWTYVEGSHTPEAQTTGFGPKNTILLTPNEFSDMLLLYGDFEGYSEKIQEGGVSARFHQDTDYPIRNAPLESYVKYLIDFYGIQNITSQQYTTVGKEKEVRIDSNEAAGYGNSNVVLFAVMHNKQPYEINYIASPKNYETYLTEFEKMVKSFRFADSPSSETGENLTNAITNFSSANLTDLSNSTNMTQEELYDQCVDVAGKSFCDFLFKR